MARSSLETQAGALRHIIALAERNAVSTTIIDAANDALRTLEFLGEYQLIVRAAIRLQRAEPALAEIFKGWPDATIVNLTDKK